MNIIDILKSPSRIKSLIRGLLIYLMRPIASIFHRNKKKWLFGSIYGTFKDNPKYLFLETIEKHPEIRAIWIGRNIDAINYLKSKGYEAYYWASIKGFYHALTAKVYICDHQLGDINYFLSGGAYYVNLWHGSSVKKVKWQAPSYYVSFYNLKDESEMRSSLCFRLLEYSDMFIKPDLCLAPSEIQSREFFAPMMDIDIRNCMVGVYPRSRLLLANTEDAMDFVSKYEPKETLEIINKFKKYQKVYIYMPTWRNDHKDFISQAKISWQELNDLMREKNELFLLKLHPLTRGVNMDEISRFSNILLFPPICDIYTILPFVDCLITDYSSIYTDFLMMNKEIILFTFDYNEYVGSSYSLEEFDKYFIGKRVDDFEQLLQVLRIGEKCMIPQKDYGRLMDFFWSSNRYNIDIVETIWNRIS